MHVHKEYRVEIPEALGSNHANLVRCVRKGNKHIPLTYNTHQQRAYRKAVAEQVEPFEDFEVKQYSTSFQFIFPESVWLTKAGDLRRLDLSNLFQVAENAFAKALGVDDRFAVDIFQSKIFNLEDDRLLIQASFDFYSDPVDVEELGDWGDE